MDDNRTFEKLRAFVSALNRRFPNGNDPFQIMTRLLEECGELAQQVNHFEASGIKREKYGEPDKVKLAQEVKGVLSCAMQVAIYYEIENELAESIETSYQRVSVEGLI